MCHRSDPKRADLRLAVPWKKRLFLVQSLGIVVLHRDSLGRSMRSGHDQLLQSPSVMPGPKQKNKLREVGRLSGDRWERFDRLQRNLRPFLCRRPKRPPIERFRSYTDLEDGRRDTTT